MGTARIGVVGTGQMGRGIAQVAASSGMAVRLSDVNRAHAQAGLSLIEKALAKRVEQERMAQDDANATLSCIRVVDSLEGLADCDVVIEAVPEDFQLKQKLFAKLDVVLQEQCILASNTSSLSITKLAASVNRSDKLIGMHFFNPVPAMALVEVIRGLQTSTKTHETVLQLSEQMGKQVVDSLDRPGFIVNRILIPMINEACFVLQEQVASAEDIDAAARLGLNHPMGPLELADRVGLDTCLYVTEVLHRELGEDKYRPCPLMRVYVAAGWLGRKSGRGFYVYNAKA